MFPQPVTTDSLASLIDVMPTLVDLSGATYPLPLKTRLGDHLATRVSAGIGTAHEVGRFKDLVIVEFLVHDGRD